MIFFTLSVVIYLQTLLAFKISCFNKRWLEGFQVQKKYKIINLLSSLILLSYLASAHAKRHPYLEIQKMNSIYTSWGISPLNKKSSINLQKAWSIFLKTEDIVVAIIDT